MHFESVKFTSFADLSFQIIAWFALERFMTSLKRAKKYESW